MQEYQQRVIEEKKELDKKAKNLSEFIGNSPDFEAICSAEQERMKVQNDIMWQYSEILGERIAAFPPVQYGYGKCPKCSAAGVSREKRPDGNDQCANRHVYKSSEAVPC